MKLFFGITASEGAIKRILYGSECSEKYAELFTELYITHLKRYGIKASEITIQTEPLGVNLVALGGVL